MKRLKKHNMLRILRFMWRHKNIRYIAILLLLSLNVMLFTDLKSFFKSQEILEEESYYFYMPTGAKGSLSKIENMMAKELAKDNHMKFVRIKPLKTEELSTILKEIEFEDHFNADSFEYNVASIFNEIKYYTTFDAPLPGLNLNKPYRNPSHDKNKKLIRWLGNVKKFKTKFTNITPYDDMIKKHAKKFGIDWRLIAAQMFIESKYKTNAKSFAGAMGLMQLTPIAMKEMGMKNAWHVEDNIHHGIKYLKSRYEMFKGYNDVNRMKFALASYNGGIGHVRDAQRLAKSYGYKHRVWNNNVDEMFLELADTGSIAQEAQYGFVRGAETVDYVHKIMKRYSSYKTLVYEE